MSEIPKQDRMNRQGMHYEVGGLIGPDGRPIVPSKMGTAYMSDNTQFSEITDTETFYLIDLPSQEIELRNFSQENCRLTHEGTYQGVFMVLGQVSFNVDSSNKNIRVRIGKNGETLARTEGRTSLAGNPNDDRDESVSLHGIVVLEPQDYVELYIGSWTDTDDITISNLQLTAIQV